MIGMSENSGMRTKFWLNDQQVMVHGDPEICLMEFLRDHMHLTGTKNGCATGHCGSCTVILDGKAMRACTIRMSRIRPGTQIETIEGLAKGDLLHPIQLAFIEHGALQCGFCIPGMIMSAKALLDENPIRTDEEIKSWLTRNHNLCRCTGYIHIIQAIQAAGESIVNGRKPGKLGPEGMEIQSTQLRNDAIEIVTGRKQYAGDILMEGILHGKILWSEHPHADILSVDSSAALAMPGVVAVVTAMDIPGKNRAGVIEVNRDQPAIAGREQKARYIGDSIASVFAETPQIAEQACRKLKVEYHVLPSVFSPEEAALPNAPKVHEKGNLLHQSQIVRGDVDLAFKQCAVVVEHDYSTPMIEHGFLEPESGVAYPDQDDGLTLLMGSQSVFDDRSQLAEILAMPEEKIRVIQIAQGGSFGGKEDPILQPHLALGALKTKRPVKIVLSRAESLRVHVKRHAAKMHIKTGADKDGHFLAMDFKVVLDTGAYMSLGYDVLENFVVFAGGPYYIPNLRVEGKSWYTNNVLAGAMRGFGVNQVAFGLEQNVDEMARGVNMDPFEFRLLNGLVAGKPTTSDHVLEQGLDGINETIQAAREMLKKCEIPAPSGASKRIGIGVASAFKNLGFGHGIPENAGTIVEMDNNGILTIRVSHHEYGQGGLAGHVKLAANEMGIPVDNIRVIGPDTKLTPPTGPTTASRQTFLSGNATVAACIGLKASLFVRAAEYLDEPPEGMQISENEIFDTVSGKHVKLAELGEKFSYENIYTAPLTSTMLPYGEPSHYGKPGFTSRMTHWAYAYGTQVAIVEVDTETGDVKVLKIIAAADLGKMLNPLIVEGQIFGGVVQGLGFALKEEFIVKNGINLTNSFHDYKLPTANDVPEIIPVVVEVSHPFGPQGAKGFAEAPSLATAPAIINAIYDAVGVRIYSLPAYKEKVLAAIEMKSKE